MAQHTGSEGSDYTPQEVFARNKDFVAPGDHSYSTDLGPQEPAFRDWVTQNKVEFDPEEPHPDYDMRGFWQALQNKDPRAMTAVNPNDKEMHYPDYWKTPYDMTFSSQSQWANKKTAPEWNDLDQLVTPDGRVVYDERKQVTLRMLEKLLQNKDLLQMLQTHLSSQGAQ